jgi:ATP-dependent Lon protease
MEQKEKLKYGALFLLGAVVILIILYYAFKVDGDTLKIIAGLMALMIPNLLSFVSSNKTNKKIDDLTRGFELLSTDSKLMQTAMDDINESFKHRKEMANLCQKIENETSNTFERFSSINMVLKEYIVNVNDVVTSIIEKQYGYDFDLFDAKYFRTKLLNKINQISEHINYIMIDKTLYEKINDKTVFNIKEYIRELKYIKDLENGKRRQEFKDLTLRLTKQITNHSIDIYNSSKTKA